jgi:crotonobetainyl-CoA:carnitine CoA-transferase CaiB-like acyl-CoA transferase
LRGDDTRQWGPPFALDAAGRPTDLSAYFMSSNRNKKSVAVDLTDPQVQAMLHDLAGRADVVIENFKPGACANMVSITKRPAPPGRALSMPPCPGGPIRSWFT